MRNHTLAVVVSSMLMAAASQAQPAPTDTTSGNTATSQSQTDTSGSLSTTDTSGTHSTDSGTATDAGTSSTTTSAGSTSTTESPNSSNHNVSSYDADQANSSDASAMAQQRWREADTDRNGSLSQAEMQTSMPTIAANFSKMDANGDGQLSKDEMHNFKRSDKDKWNQDFKAADTDRDGSVSLAEAQNGLPMVAPHFSTIDADKDGKITQPEMAAHKRAMKGNSPDSTMDADTSTRTSTSTSTTTTESDSDAPSDRSNQ